MAMTHRKAREGAAFLSFPAKLRDIWSRHPDLAGNVMYHGRAGRRLSETAAAPGGTRMTDHADLIVLGGGPAGAVSAWLAAREGLRVMLVDPLRPRPRLEGLGPRLHGWLAGQGLLRGFAGIHGPLSRQVDWAGISRGNGEYVVMREALDTHLRQAAIGAGAQLIQDSGRPEAGGAMLASGRRLVARQVIDARGRGAAPASGRAAATLALSAWLVATPPRGIRLTAFAGGWLWRVVLPDGRVWVQAMLDAAGTGRPAERLRAALAEAEPALASARIAGEVLARAAAPCLPRPVADLRMLPVGDAFAVMDPLSGHGQFWAVSSALAVAAVRRTLDADPDSETICRRFLNQRAHEVSMHQARVGRDFIRLETRFREAPFWAARRGFPDELPAAPQLDAPEIRPAIVVENGRLAEREVLHTPRTPMGIGWFGTTPAPEAWRQFQAGSLQGALARKIRAELSA